MTPAQKRAQDFAEAGKDWAEDPTYQLRLSAYLHLSSRRLAMGEVAKELDADLTNPEEFMVIWDLCWPRQYQPKPRLDAVGKR